MVYNPDDKEQPQNTGDIATDQSGNVNNINEPKLASQESAYTLPTVQKATTPQGSAEGQKFRNLRSYIDKSKSNLAGQIGQSLGQQQLQLGKQITKAEEGFRTTKGAEEVRLAQGQQEYGTVAGAAETLGQKATELAQSKESKDAAEKQNYENFAKWQQGNLANLGLQGQQQIQTGLQNLAQRAGQLGTEQGRFQALRESLGAGRQYGTGAQKLDQLLLQTKSNELKNLENLRKNVGVEEAKKFSGLTKEQQQAQQVLGEQAGAIKGNIQRGLVGAEDQLKTQLENKLKETVGSEAYKNLTQSGELTNREIRDLLGLQTKGLSGSNDIYAQSLYGLNPTEIQNLIAKNTQDIGTLTTSNIASSQDLAKAQALASLAGKDQTLIDPNRKEVNIQDYETSTKQALENLINPRKQTTEQKLAELTKSKAISDKQQALRDELAGLGISLVANPAYGGIDSLSGNFMRLGSKGGTLYPSARAPSEQAVMDILNKYGAGVYGSGPFEKGIYAQQVGGGYKSPTQLINEEIAKQQQINKFLEDYGGKTPQLNTSAGSVSKK